MKKSIFSLLTLGLLSINANAYVLQNYGYVGIGIGESTPQIRYSGNESEDFSNAVNLAFGYVSKDTHRFSLEIQSGLQNHLELEGMKFNTNLTKVKLNYDFTIKNLVTNTGMFIGIGGSGDMLHITSSDVKDKTNYGGGVLGRIGLLQDIGKSLQAEIRYEKSMDYLKFNSIDMKGTENWTIAINYKF